MEQDFIRKLDDMNCLFEDLEGVFEDIEDTWEEECESILKTVPDKYIGDLARCRLFVHKARHILDDIWEDAAPKGGA